MGLAISVGLLDFVAGDEEGVEFYRGELERINALLIANGASAHVEPEAVDHPNYRGFVSSFPYSFIHYLRRAIAYHAVGETLTEVPKGGDAADDPILAEEYYMLSSHIICHSDCDGYYVPIEFSEPIFDPESNLTLGSSIAMVEELIAVAPSLGIDIVDRALSDDEAKKLAEANDDSAPFYREKIVWFTLWELANVSVQQNATLIFH